LQRADDDDWWGQWRFRPLLGFTNMPKRTSPPSVSGVSHPVWRYYSDEQVV
jgi:hypothetical protein